MRPCSPFYPILFGLLLTTSRLLGHGEVPEAHAGGEIPDPIAGLHAFVGAITETSRNQFNAHQLEHLGEVGKNLQFEREIRANEHPQLTAKDADYYRGQAQTGLLEFLEHDIPELIELDFRKGYPPYDVMRPVPVPTLEGAVFYKVVTGDGPTEFLVQQVNLARSGDAGPFVVDVVKGGTSYVLLSFTEVPADLSRMVIPLRERGDAEPRYWSGLSIMAREPGQLSLSITDENGSSTPALVRLVQKSSGKLWAPSNAVDIWPIMTSIRGIPESGSVQPYMHYFLNMNLRGPYWIVPEPFEMALPEGDWEVYIMHGIEYVPVITEFSLTAGEWTRKEIQLTRWIDMPGRGWYSGDDHVHARMMSHQDAKDIMAFVRAADIKVANILEMGDPMRTYYEQRGFGKRYRVEEAGHVLVPGQEDPRSHFGHAIGMNLTQLARDLDKYMLNDWVADEIHRQGGLYGHTHVGEGGLGVHRDMTLLMPRGKSDFGSIMQNILGTERYYDFLNLGFKLTASAGSDTPYGGAVGITRLYAYIGEGEPFSADAWFEAVRKGHTFVTNGPILDLRVNGQLPGETILLPGRQSVKVVASASGIKGMTAPKRFALVVNGVAVQEIQPSDANQTELEIEMEIDPGTGSWIAVMAEGLDGTQAHTTPVYVHQEGFRHWNRNEAERLIGERMATLDEIEALTREQADRMAKGQLPEVEFSNVLIAEQAGQILERTTHVRSLYKDLLGILKKEMHATD